MKGSINGSHRGSKHALSVLTLIIIISLIAYRFFLPLESELQVARAPWSFEDEDRNVTIVDFFKPFDSAHPTSLPLKDYYRKINLKPVAPYSINKANFSEWVDVQCESSFERLLQNVADSELNGDHLVSEGVVEGVVIASPSKSAPDYFYQWVRDAAITMHTVVNNLFPVTVAPYDAGAGAVNVTLARTVLKYVNNSYVLQRSDNPSGQGVDGQDGNPLRGLGEPKWLVDNKPFTQNWGRPQNDGPPLRSLTIFTLLHELALNGVALEDIIEKCGFGADLKFRNDTELFEQIIYWDLRFIMFNWKEDSFDLWEEVNGKHFFTSLVQFTSIKMAISFLEKSENEWTRFDKQVLLQDLRKCLNDMAQFLTFDSGFINPNKNYIVETPSVLNQRCGLDIAVIIGSLLTHAENFDVGVPFGVTDTGVLNTLYSLVKSMGVIYPINHQRAPLNIGVALGRYPEDIYDGVGTSEGNPWFLATSAAPELLYRLILENYKLQRDLVIPLNRWESEFWTLVFDGFQHYTDQEYQLVIPWGSPAFGQTMTAVFDLGESFLDKMREHVSDAGEMSEQFNKYTGYLQGAHDLTWSYGALWSTCHARKQVLPLVSA